MSRLGLAKEITASLNRLVNDADVVCHDGKEFVFARKLVREAAFFAGKAVEQIEKNTTKEKQS